MSRLPKLAVILALVAGLTPLIAQPASADEFAPQISSFERTSGDTLSGLDLLAIRFSASDEGPAGLEYAYFTFRTPFGTNIRADSPYMNRAASGEFEASLRLSAWVPSGDYTLVKIEVDDREGNRTTYERDTYTGFDWSQGDFKVDNPNQDVTSPVLRSARLLQSSVRQGTPVVVLYTASDDLSGVSQVTFFGWSPTADSGNDVWVQSLPDLGAVGPAIWIVPLAATIGHYRVLSMMVTDNAGNSTIYQEDGRIYSSPSGNPPPGDWIDPRSLDFDVVGGVDDRSAPVMTSLSPKTPSTRHLGDIVALDYSAYDAGIGIMEVSAQWFDASGHDFYASKTCGGLTTGPLSNQIEDFRTVPSDWKLESIGFNDYLYNQVVYHRDGTATYHGEAGPPTHNFDLSQGDFHLEPGDPVPSDILSSTQLYCPHVGNVTLNLSDPSVVIGQTVKITGDVKVGGNSVPDPLVAIHRYVDGTPELVAVVQGDDAGKFESSLKPDANSQVTATFLGADGPTGAPAATSEKVHISVTPKIIAALSDDEMKPGHGTHIYGSVSPMGIERVTLQRKFDGQWHDTKSKRVATGMYEFSIRPRHAGLFRYRVVTARTDDLAAGSSATMRLRVYG